MLRKVMVTKRVGSSK